MKKKRAIVLGGAGDIGSAICKELLVAGLEILIVDVRAEALDSLLKELSGEGLLNVQTLCLDITSSQEIEKKLKTSAFFQKGLDIYVQCAGFAGGGETFGDTDLVGWQKDIQLNLSATYLSLKPVLEQMKEKRSGSIVAIGSVNSDAAYGNPAYSAAKSGLLSLIKAIAMEYGRYNIRANVVSPSSVATRAWQSRLDKNPALFDKLLKWYPLGRMVTPQAVAKAVAFLVSENADCISGINLRVDSGLSAGNALFASDITQENFSM